MYISEQRLLEIILEEVENFSEIGNYSAAAGANLRAAALAGNRDTKSFLKPIKNKKTIPIDDEIMSAIFNLTKEKVNEAPDDPKRGLSDEFLDDQQKKSIRNLVYKLGNDSSAVVDVAKRLAVPATFVASIVGGGIAGAFLSGGGKDTNSDNTVDLVDQTLVPSDIYGSGWDDYEGEFAGLSNAEKIKKTWTQYDNSVEQKAPVSSQFAIFRYSHVPAQDISDSNILPLSGMTAADYYEYWNQKVQQNPDVELPLLKKMVFGDVGKWSGGTGTDANFKKADDGSNLLPPDWTVMHSLYSDIIEKRAIDLSQAVKNSSPEERAEIYSALPGVENDEEFNIFVNNLLYSVGRQIR